MAAIESPEKVGVRPVDDFDEAQATWPRGDRPAALREAAAEFPAGFTRHGAVVAIPSSARPVPVAACSPAASPLHGAARGVNPYVNSLNRLVVIQFEDFEGERRT